jgi:hypothetical protein
LALVMVMQSIEGLTDRQAADAVRRCMDWKYVLSLDLHDPGFDFTLLHDFRQRLLAHEAGQRFLDTFLATCKARGWIKARGTQRTDSTHGLAAIRTLPRVECVLEAMHDALNQLSAAAPAWGQQPVPLDWYTRYGLRSDQTRRPKDARKREALARVLSQSSIFGAKSKNWVSEIQWLRDSRTLEKVILRQNRCRYMQDNTPSPFTHAGRKILVMRRVAAQLQGTLVRRCSQKASCTRLPMVDLGNSMQGDACQG